MPLRIEGLFWPPGAEDHVEEHIHAWEIEELIEGGDFAVFPNKHGHPPGRRRVIGRTPAGVFVTAILEEPSDGDPTQWVVITGWRSADAERAMYRQAKDRMRKKHGR
ncbi:MAG: hypothetical protein K0S78_1280 [Thermomicrobiales bacterium]|jgi:hypothetical protein|nr:hypothetical protein [Thermomicrobiales bacterium]MDF3039993.1 hypothetical protein [Thermomicrobiales bacterium]